MKKKTILKEMIFTNPYTFLCAGHDFGENGMGMIFPPKLTSFNNWILFHLYSRLTCTCLYIVSCVELRKGMDVWHTNWHLTSLVLLYLAS